MICAGLGRRYVCAAPGSRSVRFHRRRRMPATFRLARNTQCSRALHVETSLVALEFERHTPGPTNHQPLQRHIHILTGDIDNCITLRNEDSELRLVSVLFSMLQNCIPEQSLNTASGPQ